ncbi:MAG: DUF1802 family protein [Fimbriiglobus sp.]
MLNIAFKEWAAVCHALGAGRQTLILRKGGIAEDGGAFRPEHPRFWLYPTFFHAQAAGLVPDAVPLLGESEDADEPLPGILRLTHFADVGTVRFVDSLETLLGLAGLHVWSADEVTKRFHYRTPGLYVLPVRVFAAAVPHDIPERPEYAGCKTWVHLTDAVRSTPSTAVLPDAAFAAATAEIAERLSVSLR